MAKNIFPNLELSPIAASMISLKKQEELLSYLLEIREAFSGIANIQIIGFWVKQKKEKFLTNGLIGFIL